MIEGFYFPAVEGVAGIALRAQRSFVPFSFVVLAVAGNALGGCFVFVQRTGMATYTGCRRVFAAQRVLRVTVMIEGTLFPILGDMASFAFFAELALMPFFLIVGLMAAEAIRRQLLAHPSCGACDAGAVTTLTIGATVLAGERKFGFVVIEVRRRALPAPFVVAAFAFVAEATLVSAFIVVFAMASDAGERQFYRIQRRGVASDAFRCGVSATQAKAGFFAMLKRGLVPCDGGVTSLALGTKMAFVPILIVIFLVAGHALARRILESAIVMACLAFDVGVSGLEFEARLVVIEGLLFPVDL